MNRILEEDALTIAQTSINWQKFHNKTILIAGANGPPAFCTRVYDEKQNI